MKKILFAALLLPLLSLAQEKESKDGMKFEHGSWKEILAKAKAENKYIIMDCFTTWCGPCKFMDATIFPTKEAGDYFNAKFLNVKVQFDSTANDNEEVKAWKKDMKEIEKEYSIAAYPTYLVFDPSGTPVARSVGSTRDVAEFVTRGKDAQVPEKQYYTQLRKYQADPLNDELARKMAGWAQDTYDMKTASKISGDYLARIKEADMFTKDNLAFLDKFTTKSSDKGFAILLNNRDKANAVLGEGKVDTKIKNIVYAEEVVPTLRAASKKDDIKPVDFTALSSKVAQKYPAYAEEVTARGKMQYYQVIKNWPEYTSAVGTFMAKYGEKATPAELNSYAWTVFDNCKDMACVNLALGWSERSIKDDKTPGVYQYMDTYANILHRLGRTKEAIEWQEKALALAPDAAKKTYTATLEKMKKGEKTWAVTEE